MILFFNTLVWYILYSKTHNIDLYAFEGLKI